MPLKLYMLIISPSCRAVMFCAKEINLDIEILEVDTAGCEVLTLDFLKMTPQHTVPILEDDSFVLWDSHAIMPYLVSKYRKGHSLYPEDLEKRAIIDQRLHFDSNCLFPPHSRVAKALVDRKEEIVALETIKLLEAFDVIEKFLEATKYIASDEVTIADLCIWTSLSTIATYQGIDEEKYPRIVAWMDSLNELPYAHHNRRGVLEARALFTS